MTTFKIYTSMCRSGSFSNIIFRLNLFNPYLRNFFRYFHLVLYWKIKELSGLLAQYYLLKHRKGIKINALSLFVGKRLSTFLKSYILLISHL